MKGEVRMEVRRAMAMKVRREGADVRRDVMAGKMVTRMEKHWR